MTSASTSTFLAATCPCIHLWLVSLSSRNRWQGAREHLARRPALIGSPRCHGWSSLSIALGYQLAPSHSRLHKRHSECSVGTHKMIVSAPPFHVSQEVRRLLGRGPGAACLG